MRNRWPSWLQGQAAIIQIEEVVTAAGFLAQYVALPRVNLLADGESFSLKSDLAQKPFTLDAAFDPHVALAVAVVSEAVVGYRHFIVL